MTLMKFTPFAIAVSLALSACTTTGQSALTPEESKMPTAPDAKSVLRQAIQSQLRSSFDYQTTVYASNHIRRDALANATPEQLSAADNMMRVCENEHEEAYIALLKSEPSDDLDDQKQAIKKRYLSCVSDQYGVDAYESFDFEEFYQQSKDLTPEEMREVLTTAISAHAESQKLKFQEVNSAKHDGNHTALDVKKAKLLNEYLIKPTKATIVGRYQPLSGIITALPSVEYHSKNLNIAMNQPIYVDLKAGIIYLWADNFALANSNLADKNLGDKWHNKWLAIPLNDGSLPEGFAKEFIRAYLNAKKESFQSLDDASIKQVSAQALYDLPFFEENVNDTVKSRINDSTRIIQNAPTAKARAYSRYIFADTLYNDITAKYPQLQNEPTYHEYDLIDGESRINVSAPIGQSEDETDTTDKLKFSSEKFMGLLLSILRVQIDGYYDNLNQSESAAKESEVSSYAPVWHYGIKSGQINWIHYRHYLTKQIKQGQFAKDVISAKEPMFVDVFTTINPKASHDFDRLPSHLRVPNAQNSVNVFEYGNEFIERLKSSDDKYRQIMLQLLMGAEDAQEDH